MCLTLSKQQAVLGRAPTVSGGADVVSRRDSMRAASCGPAADALLVACGYSRDGGSGRSARRWRWCCCFRLPPAASVALASTVLKEPDVLVCVSPSRPAGGIVWTGQPKASCQASGRAIVELAIAAASSSHEILPSLFWSNRSTRPVAVMPGSDNVVHASRSSALPAA